VSREGYGKLSASIDDFTERQELCPLVKQHQQQTHQCPQRVIQQKQHPVTQQQQPDKPHMSTKHHLEESATKRGVNFTNVLCSAFTLVDPKSVKKYRQVISIFLLFWDLHA
jgi:hypothetical protein